MWFLYFRKESKFCLLVIKEHSLPPRHLADDLWWELPQVWHLLRPLAHHWCWGLWRTMVRTSAMSSPSAQMMPILKEQADRNVDCEGLVRLATCGKLWALLSWTLRRGPVKHISFDKNIWIMPFLHHIWAVNYVLQRILKACTFPQSKRLAWPRVLLKRTQNLMKCLLEHAQDNSWRTTSDTRDALHLSHGTNQKFVNMLQANNEGHHIHLSHLIGSQSQDALHVLSDIFIRGPNFQPFDVLS